MPRHRHVRLAALGLSHEANTFATARVDDTVFAEAGVLRGADIVARHAGGTSTMSGYLGAARDDVDVVPLIMTTLVPSGVITVGALAARVDEMVDALDQNGPFDGVLAALHGAAVAEGCLDVDGAILTRLCEVVGPDTPIGVSLDLHANISAAMCASADVVNTYRTNPHLDANTVALEVAEVVIGAARGNIRPVTAFEPVPAAINILRQNTDEAPMRDLLAAAVEARSDGRVLAASVAEGFPYADVPEMGMSVVVVTDNDQPLADAVARALAEQVWSRRAEFDMTVPTPDEAIAIAATEPGPTLLLDVGDNIGGGAPGDSVTLLNAAREANLASLLEIIADPRAVAECVKAGVGNRVSLRFGAHTYPQTGPPVVADATVLAFDDGVYEATGESVHAGMRHVDAGLSATIELDSGQTVILTSKVTPPFSIHQITRMGLDPSGFTAIVAKGVHSPRSAYAPYVRRMMMVDTPGATSADLRTLPYRHRRRPMHPFEEETTYPPV